MKVLLIAFELLLILGGIVALSGIIAAKKPNAKAILDKLVPFQALIGIFLIVLSIVVLFYVGPINIMKSIRPTPVPAMALLVGILGAIVLGGLFAMPQIMAMTASNLSAHNKALELSQRIAPYQALIGMVVGGAGVLGLLYTTGIMNYAKHVGLNS